MYVFQTASNPHQNRHCSASTMLSAIDRSNVVFAYDLKQGWQHAAPLLAVWYLLSEFIIY